MNQPSATPSNRKGRLLLGALGLTLTFGGISSKINNDLTLENNSLDREVKHQEHTIAEKTSEVSKLSGQRDNLTAEKTQLSHQVLSLGTELAERKLKVADLDQKLLATNASLEKTRSELDASSGREKDLTGKLELAARRESTLRADLTAGVEREGGLKNTIASLERARTDLNSALEMRGAELAEARKREDSIKTDLNARLGELKLGQARETMLKGEVLAGIQREQSAKSSLGALEKEKADMAAAMKSKADEIAKLDKGLGDLNKAFADAQSTKDALLKTNETLGKEKLELMGARDILQKQISELSEKIKALSDQNKGQQSTLQSLQKEKDIVADQFKIVKSEVEAIARQRDSIKGERDQFQGACNELMGKLQQLTEKMKGLEKDFTSLDSLRSEASSLINARP